MNPKKIQRERGAVLVLFGVILFVFLGMAAFAIDIGHLMVVGNELQNSADAGALAGARALLNPDGSINADSNLVAYQAATANLSGGDVVEIADYASNDGDVQRGHWTYADSETGATPGFQVNSGLTQTDLFASEDLNRDPNFINAVRVTVSRNDTPSFFANLFGFDDFQRTKSAVAYIGYAGRFQAHDFDVPIAICERSIYDPATGRVTCNIGRMINSGPNQGTNNTGGWTNFTQEPCSTASTNSVRPLVCGGNPVEVVMGSGMGTTGGELESAFARLRDCWRNELTNCSDPEANCSGNVVVDAEGNETFTSLDLLDGYGNPGTDGIPDQPWNVTLPVIDCQGSNVGNCEPVIGAVTLSIVWITESGTGQVTMPPVMNHPDRGIWKKSDYPDDIAAWNGFVDFFGLQNQGGTPVLLDNKSIYFLPSCEMMQPRGTTGGRDFYGILAQIPVLVQ